MRGRKKPSSVSTLRSSVRNNCAPLAHAIIRRCGSPARTYTSHESVFDEGRKRDPSGASCGNVPPFFFPFSFCNRRLAYVRRGDAGDGGWLPSPRKGHGDVKPTAADANPWHAPFCSPAVLMPALRPSGVQALALRRPLFFLFD